mmetsp:Transcript_60642/g.130150  ORF Transcript_60642/g.130150 Transcript_60642/m.130150 type:complete len:380 (+) Transcript_60642:72-1211(+)
MALTALHVLSAFMLASNCVHSVQIRDRNQHDMVAAVLDVANPEACQWPQNCDPHLERIKLMRVPKPRVSPGMALVRVAASSVNPQDWEGHQYDGASVPHPLQFGLDWSGTVEQAGFLCDFKAGDEVYGLGCGAYSEYIVHPCEAMGKKPASLSFVEAAVLPAAALTGLTAMQSAGAPWTPAQNVTVLVLGGAGGTGHTGIMLAKALGAKTVIATASPNHFEDCMAYGADEVIDYHTSNWWEVVAPQSIQMVYNCAPVPDAYADLSGDHAYKVLADGGTFVGLNPGESTSDSVRQSRSSVTSLVITPDISTKQVDMLSFLATQGKLTPKVDRIYSLGQLQEALEAVREKHTSGKIAIQVAGAVSIPQSLPQVRTQTFASC